MPRSNAWWPWAQPCVHDGDEGRWTLLTDPEGNEFDVS